MIKRRPTNFQPRNYLPPSNRQNPAQQTGNRQASPQQPTSFTTNPGDVVGGGQSFLPENATPAEYSQFLYDTGLQNVFQNYQQSIAILDENKQKALQDAYFIREMSMKYLGEYASNIGIGDVSGNLLDIYGQYQTNAAAIETNFGNLAANLQSTYESQQQSLFEQAMGRQMQAEQMTLAENAQTIGFNIATGRTNGMNWVEYLDSELASGNIDQQQYNVLYGRAYQSNQEQFTENLQSGFFGFNVDENGNRTPKTALEYLEENRYWLNPADYQRFRDQIEYGIQQEGTINVEVSPFTSSSTNWDFDMTNFLFDGRFNTSSINVTMTISGQPNTFTSSNETVSSGIANTLNERINARNGAFVSGQTIEMLNGDYYVWTSGPEGGKWSRLVNTTALTNQISKWTNSWTDADGVEQNPVASNWVFDNKDATYAKDGVTFNIKNKEWETTIQMEIGGQTKTFVYDYEYAGAPATGGAGNKASNDWDNAEVADVQAEYVRIHGDTQKDNATFFYKGQFYMLVQAGFGLFGKVWQFIRFKPQQ
jgi:hypothetical protein